MPFNLQFSDFDLKQVEDMLARAVTRGLVSAMRMLARENLLPVAPAKLNGVIHAVVEQLTDAPAVPASPESPLAPVPVVATKPADAESVATTAPHSDRQPRRSVKEVCKTVAHRPEGFVTTDQAVKILGEEHVYGNQLVRTWLFERTLTGAIVADSKPPTKGLPGRLHVDAAQLRARNKVRVETARPSAPEGCAGRHTDSGVAEMARRTGTANPGDAPKAPAGSNPATAARRT